MGVCLKLQDKHNTLSVSHHMTIGLRQTCVFKINNIRGTITNET